MNSNHVYFKDTHLDVENLKHIKAFDSFPIFKVPPKSDVVMEKCEGGVKLKVGFIGTEALYRDLEPYVNIFPLLLTQWDKVIKWGGLDFVIIESCNRSNFDGWPFSQISGTDSNLELIALLEACNANSIKVAYLDNQINALNKTSFDSDLSFIYKFNYSNGNGDNQLIHARDKEKPIVDVFYDSKVFSPFSLIKPYHSPMDDTAKLGFLFERFSIVEKNNLLKKCLENISGFFDIELIFVDRNVFSYKNRELNTVFEDEIKGFLPISSRVSVFNEVDVWFDYLDCENSLFEIKKRALEAAGCKVLPVIFDPHNILNDNVKYAEVIKSNDELMLFLHSLCKDGFFLERLRHAFWREAVSKHSVTKFLSQIVEFFDLKKPDEWNETKVGVVVSSFREGMAKKVVETFDAFDYENKELLLITHGYELSGDLKDSLNNRKDIMFFYMPKNANVGECLNLGVNLTDAHIVARVDDDDIYGVNYLTDIVLQLETSESDFLAKPRSPIFFQDSKELIVREGETPMAYCLGEDLKTCKVKVGGNSFSGRRSFFIDNPFCELSNGACDTATLRSIQNINNYRYCIGDAFNLVAVRSLHSSDHTWNISKDRLIENSEAFNGSLSDFFI